MQTGYGLKLNFIHTYIYIIHKLCIGICIYVCFKLNSGGRLTDEEECKVCHDTSSLGEDHHTHNIKKILKHPHDIILGVSQSLWKVRYCNSRLQDGIERTESLARVSGRVLFVKE